MCLLTYENQIEMNKIDVNMYIYEMLPNENFRKKTKEVILLKIFFWNKILCFVAYSTHSILFLKKKKKSLKGTLLFS